MSSLINENVEVIDVLDDRFRSGYRKKVTIDCSKDGKTEQAQKTACDINFILRNYQRTGTLEHAKEFAGKYDDVTVQDFTEAMNLVTDAQNMFISLPSSVRSRFGNDPAQFLAFVNDKNNVKEMVDLGLMEGVDGVDKDGQLNDLASAIAERMATETTPS